MEAVSTIRNGVSSKVVVAVAIVATFTLGGGSGYLVKTLSLPATHIAPQSSASQVVDGPQSDLTRVLPGELPAGAGQIADGPQSDLTRVLPGELPAGAVQITDGPQSDLTGVLPGGLTTGGGQENTQSSGSLLP